MQALLEGRALVDGPDAKGKTALMAAASAGHIACMEVLLSFDAGRHPLSCHLSLIMVIGLYHMGAVDMLTCLTTW